LSHVVDDDQVTILPKVTNVLQIFFNWHILHTKLCNNICW
jgi:hypothetical protein